MISNKSTSNNYENTPCDTVIQYENTPCVEELDNEHKRIRSKPSSS